METTNITARFMRRLPREQYGHSEAELSANAVLEDGADLGKVAEALITTIRDTVLNSLRKSARAEGKELPGETAAPANDNVDDAAVKALAAKAEKAEKAKAKRDAKKAETAKTAEAAKAADIPDEPGTADTNGGVVAGADIPDEPKANISTGEERTDPAADVPDDDEGLSASDLHTFVGKLVGSNQVTVPAVKEILAGFGATRTMEVPAESREAVRAAIEALASV